MEYSVKKTIDRLGRIVLPKNLRDFYGIKTNDVLKIIPGDKGILIIKVNEEASKDNS